MLVLPDWLTASIKDDPLTITPYIEWSGDWVNWHRLMPISGSHSQDRTRQNRWAFSGNFQKDYEVDARDGAIHPYGCRARVWLGLTTLRQSTFWIPQGLYVITTATESDDNISLSIEGESLESEVIDSDFPKARNIPDRGGLNYRDQAVIIITEAVPDASFNWDKNLNLTLPIPTTTIDSGRWDFIDGTDQAPSLCGSLGAEAYCDSTGRFTFKPVPTLNSAPVWWVPRGGALVSSARGFDRDNVFNFVSATGDSSDGTTSVGPGYAWDNDKTSIMYAGSDPVNFPGKDAGKYGLKPIAYTNSLIANDYQANIAARAQFANYHGFHYTVTFTAKFNPASEAGDVVAVEVNPGRWDRHLLDSLTYNWGDATVAATTRSPKEDLAQ